MASCRAVIARLIGGMTYLPSRYRMIANASSSTKNVPLGTRKLLASGTTWVTTVSIYFSILCLVRIPGPRGSRAGCGSVSLAAEHEDEQRHEGQVDEEHRLDQTHGQEEDRLET